LEPLLQQQAKLEADALRLALAGNRTTDLHRVTTELTEIERKIDQMKREDHDDNDLEDMKDDSVGFQHPFLTLLDTKHNQAYDSEDFDTAQTLEALRDSALPICMDLVKATNAYTEATTARQKASVVINLKARKEELERRLSELQQQLSRITLVSSPITSSGSSNPATITSFEPSRGVVQPQAPVRASEANVGAEEKKQDVTHHVISASPTPTTPHVTRPTTTAIDERQVLMELFHATGGSGWTKKDNWGTDRLLITWHGVKVGEDGRVTHLQLPGNNLTGKRMSSDTPS
jgi:hypothetical protein